jgi:hypothetical protein
MATWRYFWVGNERGSGEKAEEAASKRERRRRSSSSEDEATERPALVRGVGAVSGFAAVGFSNRN